MCVCVHGWNVYFRWINTIFAPAKRTKNHFMNERTTEGGNEGKKEQRHMPALMNAGIYLDFSSSPQTRAFLHQQDAVTTRETPNRLCPAHWRCPDLYACFVLEIDVFHVFTFTSFLSGMISTNVILQIHANTMLLGRIRFHYASQQFRILPRQIQILSRSDKMTAWTFS